MKRLENREAIMEELGIKENRLGGSDPDFVQITDAFVYGTVYPHCELPERKRELLILAVLCTNPNMVHMKQHVDAALKLGVSPEAIKEVIYQCTPYIGIGKVEDSLSLINQVFKSEHITLPVSSQTNVTEETRFYEGIKRRAEIFGEGTYQMVEHGPEELRHIQEYLCSYCFGDFYTRSGLDLKTRELLTFCILAALGGCESQVKSHIKGNLAVGNEKSVLLSALTVCLPFIGFPRTLNAITCVNEIISE